MSEDDFNDAKLAFDGAAWRGAIAVPGWDCYLFDDRLALYPAQDAGIRQTDLRNATFTTIELHSHPRLAPEKSLTSMQVNLLVPKDTDLLDVRVGGAEEYIVDMRGHDTTTRASLLVSGAQGSRTSRPRFSVTGGRFRSIEMARLKAIIASSGSDKFLWSLRDCEVTLAGDRVAGLTVARDVVLHVDNLNVDYLRFDGRARLELSSSSNVPGHMTAAQVTPAAGQGGDGVATVAAGTKITAADVAETSILLEAGARLLVNGEASNLSVAGQGALTINRQAINLNFEGNGQDPAGYPRLDLARHAVIQNTSGGVRLGDAANAQINGNSSTGFVIHELAADSAPNGTDGLIVREFRVPVTLAGLQILGTLAQTAAVAIPAIAADLPGTGRWTWRHLFQVRSFTKRSVDLWRDKLDVPATEHLAADYAAALAQVGEAKGSPGSVRTQLAWLEYRMRQRTSKGGVERTTLAAYRMLGYGERAGPPLALSGVVAVTTALVVLMATRSWDFSWDGASEVGKYTWDWASSPLHILRLTERSENSLGDSRWVFVGRILIAIPFVTGVLALRKYIKRNASSD